MGDGPVRRTVRRVDRGLYALFSRHADRPRHDIDRDRYRGTTLPDGFDAYLSRVYGLSWGIGVLVGASVFLLGGGLSVPAFETVGSVVSDSLPDFVSPRSGSVHYTASILGTVSGLLAKRCVVAGGGTYLRWRASARRAAIERTLPGAVRYLRMLADGNEGRRTILRTVAEREAYGETSVSFQRVLETASLTGSLDSGLRTVARQTPSRELLSPFLLQLRERANQGPESLRTYLRMESRMLSHRQSRARQRTGVYLTLLAELFVVLLAVPALFAVVVTVASVLAPGLSQAVPLPGAPTVRGVLVYGSLAFVLLVGAGTAFLIVGLRPPNHARTYGRPTGISTVATATTNPASAAFVFAFPAVVVGWGTWMLGEPVANVVLFGYAAYGFPVGAVALKRERLDDAKDRGVRDFVHAVAGHVSRGMPFATAVENVAHEVDFGVLQGDVDDLAFLLGLTGGPREADTRTKALDRFVTRIGTPLAEQAIGLVTGALDAGSDVETTFVTLQTEVGTLYHRRRELRSAMFAHVAIGWAAAFALIGIVLAVDVYVLEGVTRLSTASQNAGIDVDPSQVDTERDAWRLYLLAQTTMLACGWFAGVASRGRYEALLHSSALVVICYLVFAGAGIV